jgi:1-acyl-sn-glycerol-3-phosphate acyltransferase
MKVLYPELTLNNKTMEKETDLMVQEAQKEDGMPFRYNHAKYEKRRRFLRFLIRNIGFTVLARIDRVEGLENIPAQGPAILMINHIAMIDPIVVMNVIPRRNIVPMAKI